MKTWLIWTIVGVGVVGSGLLIYFGLKDDSDKDSADLEPTKDSGGSSGGGGKSNSKPNTDGLSCSENYNYPLKKGMCGKPIKKLQEAINNYYINTGKINMKPFTATGFFGDKTLTAVKKILGTTQVNTMRWGTITSGQQAVVSVENFSGNVESADIV